MKIKLSRIFNVFNKRYIYAFSIFAIIMIVFVISMYEAIVEAPFVALFIFLLTFIIFFWISLLPFPSSILVDEERITYITLAYEELSGGENRISNRRFPKITNVEISAIGGIFYYQSRFEKLFKVGHIEIAGKTYLTTKKGDPFYIMNVDFACHIYGVKKFEIVKKQLKELYPQAEHIEK